MGKEMIFCFFGCCAVSYGDGINLMVDTSILPTKQK